ncbi:MAG TPA: hypothetical protein PK156_47100 [Polyangium sp.]|nr:hypothetical protein [Polyangium sp.]
MVQQQNKNSNPRWGPRFPRVLAAVLGLLGVTATGMARADEFWAALGSEETPPRTCPAGYLVGGFRCTGRYCDNVAPLCRQVNRTVIPGSWTRYFSEEDNSETCGAGFMTGIACNGSYCDNISLQCSYVSGATPRDCLWLNTRLSEEGGSLVLPSDLFINGIACYGRYCDDKDFLVCRL